MGIQRRSRSIGVKMVRYRRKVSRYVAAAGQTGCGSNPFVSPEWIYQRRYIHISKYQYYQTYPAHLLYQQTKPPELRFLHLSSWQPKVSVLDSILVDCLECEKKVQEKTITRIDGKENVSRMYLADWSWVKIFVVVVFDWMERMQVMVMVNARRRGCSICQVLDNRI